MVEVVNEQEKDRSDHVNRKRQKQKERIHSRNDLNTTHSISDILDMFVFNLFGLLIEFITCQPILPPPFYPGKFNIYRTLTNEQLQTTVINMDHTVVIRMGPHIMDIHMA